jgi:hypothetical protein
MKLGKMSVTLRVARGALALSLVAGCSARDEARLDDVAESSAAINRGVLVTSNTAPYSSVVRLQINFSATSVKFCSALKIRGDRYLTSAHCFLRSDCGFFPVGGTIDVSNALTANVQSRTVTTSAIYIHPSFRFDFLACNAQELGTNHSYDIAIFDTSGDQTPAIPAANAFWPNFVSVGTAFREVGYGKDALDSTRFLKKQYADYVSVSDADPAAYAHLIRTSESQSSGAGDSGGPLFYESSPGTWRVAGVTQTGNGADGRATAVSTFARVANVGGWINSPHNGNVSTGIGFFQNVAFQQCMQVPNSSAGTTARLGECEGYDPNIHGQMWEAVASGSFIQIRTRKSGVTRCLDVQAGTNLVVLANCGTGQGQQWTIAPHRGTPSAITIQNRLTGLYLNPNGQNGVLNVTQDFDEMWLFYR